MSKISLFGELEHYLSDLEEMLPDEDLFLNSKVHQYGVSMLMMNIINACIDIGSEIISIKQFGHPGSYRDIFEILEKEKVIPVLLSKKLKDLVGLRNLLAHEYGKIDFELIYEQAKEIYFVEDFIKKAV